MYLGNGKRTVDLFTWNRGTKHFDRWGNCTWNINNNTYGDITRTLEPRKLPGYIPEIVKYEDVKGRIDLDWIAENRDKAERVSTDTFSKVVYIFTDFVVKVGGKDVKTEADLWFEICDNAELADMFIATHEIRRCEDVFGAEKYISVQARVDGTIGVDDYVWSVSERIPFTRAITAHGYFVDDLHHMNVARCNDGKIRTFDYSWWERVDSNGQRIVKISMKCNR